MACGYIVWLSLSYAPSAGQFLATLLAGILLALAGCGILRVPDKDCPKVFLGLLLLGGIVRLVWILVIPTLPVSDFEYYRRNAVYLLHGLPVSTRNMGYTLLLSMGFRVAPGLLTGKLLNVIAGTMSLALLYAIGSRLGRPKVGLMAVLLFAILPSEINMTSVLGTEILAVLVLLSVTYFLLCGMQSGGGLRRASAVFAAGCIAGWGWWIRSSLVVLLPILVLGIVFTRLLPTAGKKIKILCEFLLGMAAGACMIILAYSLLVGYFSLTPLRAQDYSPLLAGTNIEHKGQWNVEDAILYSSWSVEDSFSLTAQEALRRIASDPAAFLRLIPQKFAILFRSNDYGNYWSLEAVDWGDGNRFGVRSPAGENLADWGKYQHDILAANKMLTQAAYTLLWLFALFALLRRNVPAALTVTLAAILSMFLFHAVLEVQARYHHYIMPFVTLQAAYGVIQFSHALRKCTARAGSGI